jgi:hypothetical protein
MEELHAGYLTPHCADCPFWLDGSDWDFGCGYNQFDQCPYIPNSKNKQNIYSYNGPVMMFGRVIDHWTGETMAVSERKAKSNLIFRYKKEKGYAMNSKISLPGLITKGDI